MKKIILTALVAVASLSANAQVWMGGSLGFNNGKYEGANKSTTTITFAPVVGYSLDDKWDIALELEEQNISHDGESANNFSIAPFARYSFAQSGIATFFVDGGFSYGSTEYANNRVYDSSVETFTIGLRPGVKIELSDKVELESHLGWFGYTNIKDTYSEFGLNVNNSVLSLGMTWKF